jgi:hypothetical protein
MDADRFDALTKRLATGGASRRRVLKGLGGSLLGAVLGGAETGWASAAPCPSGVVCSARCCPNASDICLAGKCTSCPSGKVCSAQCCPNASDICLAGKCTSCPSGVICSAQCCAAGETCQAGQCAAAPTTTPAPQPGPCGAVGAPCAAAGDCCAPNVCANAACAAACPPGYRECDGVCYPGGCCTDADCGGSCLVCGADHTCHSCPASQVCQGGVCVPATRPCGQPGATCATNADCCSGDCVGGVCACGGPGTACTKPTDCCGLTCEGGQCGCLTCAELGAQCGTVTTPCGRLDCGPCPAGRCLTCGANNTCAFSCASGQVCHAGACCTPKTCAALGKTCGTVADGCGGTLHCGTCEATQCQTCGADNTCVSTCTAGQVCCGGTCLTCPSGQICCDGTCKLPLGGAGCRGDADCCSGQTCCGGTCRLPAGASGCRGNGDCCSHTIDGSDVCCGGTCCYTCQGCNSAGPNCAGAQSNAC